MLLNILQKRDFFYLFSRPCMVCHTVFRTWHCWQFGVSNSFYPVHGLRMQSIPGHQPLRCQEHLPVVTPKASLVVATFHPTSPVESTWRPTCKQTVRICVPFARLDCVSCPRGYFCFPCLVRHFSLSTCFQKGISAIKSTHNFKAFGSQWSPKILLPF